MKASIESVVSSVVLVRFFLATNSISWSTSLLYARMVAEDRPKSFRSLIKFCFAVCKSVWSVFIKYLIIAMRGIDVNG